MLEKDGVPAVVEGQPVEEWAIEAFLSHEPSRHIERTIRAAMEDPTQNPVVVARSFMWGAGRARIYRPCSLNRTASK